MKEVLRKNDFSFEMEIVVAVLSRVNIASLVKEGGGFHLLGKRAYKSRMPPGYNYDGAISQ